MHATRDTGVHAPDRAGAKDDEEVTFFDAELFLGVDGAGERFGGASLVEIDVVGDAIEAVYLEYLRRDDHIFRKTTVVLITDAGLVLADLHPPFAALVALPARDSGDRLDPIADLPVASHLGADFDDLASNFVAHCRDSGDVLVAVVKDLDVGATGGAVANLDLDLVGLAFRFGDVFETNVLGCVEPQCLHDVCLSIDPLIMPAGNRGG